MSQINPTQASVIETNAYDALALTGLFVLCWVILGLAHPFVPLSENQSLYVFSSASQVVGALYGFTIAGYTFFRGRYDKLAEADDSLIDALERIQLESYAFIKFLTFISLSSIAASLLAIVYRESSYFLIKTVSSNLAASLFTASIIWTCHFVLLSVKPGQIDRASKAIKAELEQGPLHSSPPPEALIPHTGILSGGLERFLASFNKIEAMLEAFASRHLDKTVTYAVMSSVSDTFSSNSGAWRQSRARWTKQRIVRALESQEIIPSSLANQIASVIKYRNALVHGKDLSTSPEAIDNCESCSNQLAEYLYPYIGSDFE